MGKFKGPVRLELSRCGTSDLIEAELGRERYRKLELKVGDPVFLVPRNIQVFVEDYTI